MPKFARSHALTRRVAACAATLCIAWIAAQSDTQADVQAVTVTKFGSPGTDLPFVVPDGVTSIHVVAIGGAGGLGAHNPASGGLGAVVSGDIAVTPGQTLFVDVAGNGGNANNGIGGSGGLNGGGAGGNSGTATAGKAGGGGGGESGIRSTAGAVLTGLILASGGGGAGGGSQGGTGGSSSVSDGKDGQSGDVGATKNMEPGGAAGPGGTSSGAGGGVHPGHVGGGGAGEEGSDPFSRGGGGGGGAGFFGGGGGGAAKFTNNDGGGGGAGSSASASASAGGTVTNTSYTRDTIGSPSVTITYVPSTAGGGGGGGGGGNNSSPLVLSALKASSRSFGAAGHGGSTGGTVGTSISYTGSAGATTTFTVLAPRSGIRSTSGSCVKRGRGKHGRHCTRYVSVGGFTHSDSAGFNTFVFTGRVRHHKLRPGSYRLQAIARLNGQTTAAVTLSFRIKR